MVKKNGAYIPTKTKPFSGEGYRLGSVVPQIIESSASDKILKDSTGFYIHLTFINIFTNF